MDLKTIASRPNLNIAWRRITSGLNISYKSRYRHIFEAYELASARALRDLRERLIDGTYVAQPPLRYYYPKASGLQRPISFLVLEDQIVLQALANLFAKSILDSRRGFERRTVFSNCINPPQSPFAVERWSIGYNAMLVRIEQLYRSGYQWVVKFDLSAFYDTISHDLLMRTISPRGGSRTLVEAACQWLFTWSSSAAKSRYSHGIPQGPVASDVLGECFLLPIDEAMSDKHKYVRYVDDIRIFGKSRDEISQAMVLLDTLCRERGLIPHVDKLGVLKVRTLRKLRELAPRIDAYHGLPIGAMLSEPDAWASIQSSLGSGHRTIEDKTMFRFSLFRAPRSPRIMNVVLRLWPAFPEHTDAFSFYLEQHDNSSKEAASASRLVRSRYPYDAVRGEQWRLLARFSSIQRMSGLVNRAVSAIQDPTTGTGTRLGILEFLCASHKRRLGNYALFLRWAPHPLFQAFSAPHLPLPLTSVADTASHLLMRSVPDTSLALLRALQISGTDPRNLLPPGEHLNPVAQGAFEEAGLVPTMGPRHRDRLGRVLARRFQIQTWRSWRPLLGNEYAYAHSLALMAESYYSAHYTPWLLQLDSLNEAVFRALQSHLNRLGIPGAIQTVYQNGRLIDYGTLIHSGPFNAAFPALAAELKDIHRRRNRLPTSHPYDKRTGARATALTYPERASYRAKLGRAYSEVIRIGTLIGL